MTTRSQQVVSRNWVDQERSTGLGRAVHSPGHARDAPFDPHRRPRVEESE
jgi:hypothetical protein